MNSKHQMANPKFQITNPTSKQILGMKHKQILNSKSQSATRNGEPNSKQTPISKSQTDQKQRAI
jgi:hypothetical protein